MYESCKGVEKHWWDEVDAERFSGVGTPHWFRCQKCDTIKKEVWDIHGNLNARWYEYPEGYKDEGVGRISITQYRVAHAARAKKEAKKRRKK